MKINQSDPTEKMLSDLYNLRILYFSVNGTAVERKSVDSYLKRCFMKFIAKILSLEVIINSTSNETIKIAIIRFYQAVLSVNYSPITAKFTVHINAFISCCVCNYAKSVDVTGQSLCIALPVMTNNALKYPKYTQDVLAVVEHHLKSTSPNLFPHNVRSFKNIARKCFQKLLNAHNQRQHYQNINIEMVKLNSREPSNPNISAFVTHHGKRECTQNILDEPQRKKMRIK